jgi:cysteine synthase A
MMVVDTILEAIGNTPLVRLRGCAPSNGAELWLKLEYLNPTGSMKDRMALAMINGAERDRLLSPGDTVVEYTGGSTGPALALVCRAKGYRALIVIADCFTAERFQLMRALGAELDVVPSVEGPPKVTPRDITNMVARASELAAQPGHYATDQFNNPYIIPDHRDHLGQEILEPDGGPRYGVLPWNGNGKFADGRLGRPQASWRVHSGSRAGRIGRDQRRCARAVPHPRLDGAQDAALGPGPR